MTTFPFVEHLRCFTIVTLELWLILGFGKLLIYLVSGVSSKANVKEKFDFGKRILILLKLKQANYCFER